MPEDIINVQHDPLTCASVLGWNQGVAFETIPLAFAIRSGWLTLAPDPTGKPTRLVSRVDGNAFNTF